jgi:hypothetical protein
VNPLLLNIIGAILKIAERHQAANPGAPPLTAEQALALLIAEIGKGEDRDLAWFLLKNLPPPK